MLKHCKLVFKHSPWASFNKTHWDTNFLIFKEKLFALIAVDLLWKDWLVNSNVKTSVWGGQAWELSSQNEGHTSVKSVNPTQKNLS